MQKQPSAAWRPATPGDAESISAIERQVHSLTPERLEVIREKIALFAEGCRILVGENAIVGYGVAFPWTLDDVPALDTFLGALPSTPQCLYIHDVAMLAEARGRGAGGAYLRHVSEIARRMGLASLALVSVYGTHHLWGRYGFAIQPAPGHPDKLVPYGDTARYMVAALH